MRIWYIIIVRENQLWLCLRCAKKKDSSKGNCNYFLTFKVRLYDMHKNKRQKWRWDQRVEEICCQKILLKKRWKCWLWLFFKCALFYMCSFLYVPMCRYRWYWFLKLDNVVFQRKGRYRSSYNVDYSQSVLVLKKGQIEFSHVWPSVKAKWQ